MFKETNTVNMSAFQTYFLDVLKHKYADFSGRARRSEYWFYTLFTTLIALGFVLLLIPFIGGSESGSMAMIPLAFLGIFYLGVMIPSLAVLARRLHDSGKSAWFILLSFVPFGSIVLLVFTLLDSEPRTNKWGPDPKSPNLQNTAADHLLEDDIV